jgi:hypothetical protein
MKQKLLLNCIIALIFSSSAFAQFQKGNQVLGFGLGFSAGKAETQNNSFAPINKNNAFNGYVELGFSTKAHKLQGFFVGAAISENKTESRQP